jgi:pimeloyl-ACP methyl ester carboxylesterase
MRFHRPMITVMIWIVVGYCIIGLFVYVFQYKIVYHPHTYSLDKAMCEAQQHQLRLWPTEDKNYHGLISLEPPCAPKGVILIFHGNAGSALDRLYYTDILQNLGYVVLLMEYPGYGAKAGHVGEHTLVAAAGQAADIAQEQFNQPLIVIGESLGCGIAAAVAGTPGLSVDGLVLITPWDTLGHVAQSHYWYLPARWFVKDTYNNIEHLRNFPGPVAVVMADRDSLIPNTHTQRLYESLTGFKRLWLLQGVGHNDWPAAVDSGWWREIMGFIHNPDL